jgi:hypothetical protein
MTAKTATNRSLPILNQGGFRPTGAVVFKPKLLITIKVGRRRAFSSIMLTRAKSASSSEWAQPPPMLQTSHPRSHTIFSKPRNGPAHIFPVYPLRTFNPAES